MLAANREHIGRFAGKLIAPCLALWLTGCMGGPIAQQIAQSVAMRSLDKTTSDAYDNYLLKQDEASRSLPLKDTEPDPYWASFVTSGFSTVETVKEPLPDYRQASTNTPSAPDQAMANGATAAELDSKTQAALVQSKLVRVELWNLLIGDEKRSILEKARLMGAAGLPPTTEWPRWQLATGAPVGDNHQPITFLIPPDFGRMKSGDYAVVEVAGAGELNVARYPGH
ncbi:hypothetical protein [Methylovorus sp. MP688]|jgi:hypothetical protein|uniref:hypothetical protein n=1 Tax=Methylovorus sp. (strain MP688) TaxID=887061 RepID=UPI0001EC4782|nr:hypothetical protein [Methylovorus sp. MP688]ADQ84786.1 conserved hypothetical protein [Methylovorus sp. MP688]